MVDMKTLEKYRKEVHSAKTIADKNRAYLKILDMIQGSWDPETAAEKKRSAAQRKLELKAAKAGKNAW
jgi:hypothetical protein